MSMNPFMHPRNIYRTPPDFTQLALEHPEFRAVGSLDVNGKVRLDFKNENTLRALSMCLLKRDFGLNVALPADKIIPTLPLRLNYILWLEDIMQVAGRDTKVLQISGIDIGCGASCVYPLIAAKRNHWKMRGLEINPESIRVAKENITQNQLDNHIEIIQQQPEAPIFESLLKHTKSATLADFCMCNPPFFSSLDDLATTSAGRRNRSGKRSAPNNIQSGCPEELVVIGGEIEFVRRIIHESCELKDRIRVYTTMLGHKNSVSKVLQILRERDVRNVSKTEFCQGHTTRWGVAWSFFDNIPLKNVPTYGPSSVKSANKPKSYSFTIHKEQSSELEVQERLTSILKSIDLTLADSGVVCDNLWSGRLVAHQNTWSKQRRKRREVEREQSQKLDLVNVQLDASSPDKSLYEHEPKRRRVDETCESDQPILVANIKILHCNDDEHNHSTVFDVEYVSGSTGRDGAYQLMQFIQNKWK